MISNSQKPLLGFDFQAQQTAVRVQLFSPMIGVWQLLIFPREKAQPELVAPTEHCSIEKPEAAVFRCTQPFYVKDDKGNTIEQHYRFQVCTKSLQMSAWINDDKVWETAADLPSPFCIEPAPSGLRIGFCAQLSAPVYGGGSPTLPDDLGRLKTLPDTLQKRLRDNAKVDLGLGDRTGSSLHSAQAGFSPLLWSAKGWGLALSSDEVQHELGTQQAHWHEMFTQGPFALSLYLGSPAEIFNRHTYVYGRLACMPFWSVGLGWKTHIDDADAVIEAARQLDIAVDALHCQSPTVVRWDDKQQLQPTGQVLLPDQVRCVLEATPLFSQAAPSEYCVQQKGKALSLNGAYCLDLQQESVMSLWQKGLQNAYPNAQFRTPADGLLSALSKALPPAEVDAYRRTLLEGAYQLSARDQLPVQGVCYGVPACPQEPQWPLQKLTAVSGDWDGLTRLHREHLALENAGFFSLYHDLNAFQKLDAELFLRLVAYISFTPANVLSGAMLTHIQSNSKVFTPEVMDKAKSLLRFRSRLLPYFYGLLSEESRNGGPVMRSLSFEFPQDPVALQYPDQYLLGASLLVAPVLRAGVREATVYLPEGAAWWHLASGQRFEGGQCVTVPAELGTVPAFGREGHMLCLGHELANVDAFDFGKILSEVWLFGMPTVQPAVMRNKIRILFMQGSSYVKGLEGLSIVQPQSLQYQRRGSEVRISRRR